MIGVVDTGLSNIRSVVTAVDALGHDVVQCTRGDQLDGCERVILPGVGTFGDGMAALRATGLAAGLDRARADGRPILGICLGMQLMAASSEESPGVPGLGWFDAPVVRLRPTDPSARVPHVGWNAVRARPGSPLFAGVVAEPDCYFVHSYHLAIGGDVVEATTEHGQVVTAAVRDRNVAATQFHPEKSQDHGLRILDNFLCWVPAAEPGRGGDAVLKRRLIPKLSVVARPGGTGVRMVLVTTVGFRRELDVGDPVSQAKIYEAQAADELTFLHIRPGDPEHTAAFLALAERVAEEVFMPITVGGGVRRIDDVRACLAHGADKVLVDTGALENPLLVTEAANAFGVQCVVLGLDVRRDVDGRPEVMAHNGTVPTGRDPIAWAVEAERLGAGEVLVTAIDRDGSRRGLDLDLVAEVAAAVRVPVIASGGCGTAAHFVEGFAAGADAVAAGTYFSFRDENPMQTRSQIRNAGFPIRLHT